MKPKQFVKENIENVPSQSSAVLMENVFQADGDAVNLNIIVESLKFSSKIK